MTATTFHAAFLGPFTLDLTAPTAEITIETVPCLTKASARITGPAEIIDQAVQTLAAQRWMVTLPQSKGTMTSFGTVTNVSHRGGAVIQAGNISGTVAFSGGDLYVGSSSATPTAVVSQPASTSASPRGPA
ncbi:hypothetical protein BJF83_18875 [Nocardiopsis sp. CNR-923]|uniref:hypothetical protein n=1 Tax=Nocardiopsis sp. CNR-923 TaxID=1904965 RepID=UPI0009644157|nr:hypothetical protein [Nocardiopsis sp. CNR-923]OLT27159.1 hypothetical protein BJF83_18875 [Nocardiopsis sp. CNR-923]